jgi:membrane-associated protease RseP (regulator of RpoE activity)
MRTVTKIAGAAVGLALLLPQSVEGQGVVSRAQSCSGGVLVGDLGISGLDCVGECSMIIYDGGRGRTWKFSTEPRIFSIQAGGPADGILEAGDFLVALDGVLITSREGGRRYANLEIGEIVSVRYRRDREVREGRIRTGSECRRGTDRVASAGRVPPPPPPDRVAGVIARGVATAPRVVVTPDVTAEAAPLAGLATGVSRVASLLDPTPQGRLGIGFSCTECGTQTDEESGDTIWFFSGPLEVTRVTKGGPADQAGLRMGDLITGVGGFDLDTEAGGQAFSGLAPGEPATLTVVKRNGRKVDVEVVPVEAGDRVLVGRTVLVPEPDAPTPPSRTRGVVSRAVPVPPDREAYPEPMADVAAPVDLPLSYSGTVAGVEVEVRGGPVAVSEMKGARILLINAEGLWIRIRVPAGTGRRDAPDPSSR